jgi:hypothetical protein
VAVAFGAFNQGVDDGGVSAQPRQVLTRMA